MPSGTTHDRITLWTLPWIVAIGYGLTGNGELTLLLLGGFLFSGLMFGPDLDIYSVQYKRWGILRCIWLPYRRLMRHRSFFSHGIVIGTCIRILYLLFLVAWLAIFTVGLAQLLWGFPWNWHEFVRQQFDLLTNHYHREATALFIGLELGAMSHSLSDTLVSYHQKRLKQKSKKTKVKAKNAKN